MPRTLESSVIEILNEDNNYSDGASLVPYIETAHQVVNDNCVDTTTYTYTVARLELIERWLSAYFYLLMNPVVKFSSVGKVQESFESKIDLGFWQNKYGQAAMILDTAGNLAALSNALEDVKKPLPAGKKTMSITWLGTECPRR